MSNPELFSMPTEPAKGKDPHLDEEAFMDAVDKRKKGGHLSIVPEPEATPEEPGEWRLSEGMREAGRAHLPVAKAAIEEARARAAAAEATRLAGQETETIRTPNEDDFDEYGDLKPGWNTKRAQ